MSRLLPAAIVCCAVAIGATTYSLLGSNAADGIEVPGANTPAPGAAAASAASTELEQARRTCAQAALDALIAKWRAAVQATPTDRASWRLLAEALLERVLQRAHLRGIEVGTPLHETLPVEVAADLDAGTAAVVKARELGDDSGELFRIEAALMGHRITGLTTALQWNGKIQQALTKAAARAKDDPQLHIALGLRKRLVPKFLGQDPQKALEHFEFAARQLPDDERPAVFAAMASYLQQKREQAMRWLEQAVQRNPQNTFARVVLERVKRGEQDPFGRDVSAAEASGAK